VSAPPRRRLSAYHYGKTAVFAAQADQRASYCLYVPTSYEDDAAEPYPVVVAMHGTLRTFQAYRDGFADFAEANRAVVLAPLFPAGVGRAGDPDGYKFIEFEGIRYDELLLAILDEVAALYRLDVERVLLHGFSGGAHFAHRFLYLHPERLRAVSIGAPGAVTLLDFDRPWWIGVADVEERFGRAVDVDALRRVAVQTVVGELDTETWEITIPQGSWKWMPGANDSGVTRIDRIRALADSLEAAGIAVRRDVVPRIGHSGTKALGPVKEFFAEQLELVRVG
jgi:dienelactone hydrolase